MAWPTGGEIRDLLPVEDPVITPEQCQGFINEWVGLIKEAGKTDAAEETATTLRIVRRGALADALEKLIADSGYVVDPDLVKNMRTWAEKALETYRASKPAVASSGAVGATVHNVTPEPLWGDPCPEGYSERY